MHRLTHVCTHPYMRVCVLTLFVARNSLKQTMVPTAIRGGADPRGCSSASEVIGTCGELLACTCTWLHERQHRDGTAGKLPKRTLHVAARELSRLNEQPSAERLPAFGDVRNDTLWNWSCGMELVHPRLHVCDVLPRDGNHPGQRWDRVPEPIGLGSQATPRFHWSSALPLLNVCEN